MDEPKEKLTVAELTRKYIDRHPSVRDCISKDLVNFSSLSRLIMKETGVKHEEAVLAASRRYAAKLSKTDFEGDIMSVFEESRLELKTRICIVVAKNEWVVLRNLEEVVKKMLAEKSDDADPPERQRHHGHLRGQAPPGDHQGDRPGAHHDGQAEPRRDHGQEPAEDRGDDRARSHTSLSMLSEQGINLLEAVSCYTDTIVIVTRDDMMRAFEILSGIIENRVSSMNGK